jgi:3',5'-cyclic AMP phosphodiesterase CpdA
MRRIAHLSDLHFGRIAPSVLAPLRDCVRKLEPHLVAVSGDLTATAKAAQFRDARAFLDTLPGPQIVVPGTGDLAPGGMFGMSRSLDSFRRLVSDDTGPEYADDTIAVIGVSDDDARPARTRVHGLDARAVRIVVSGLPLLDTGADVVLTGSRHEVGERESPAPLVIQSGYFATGASRAEILSLHALHIEGPSVTVERWSWNGHTRRFESQGRDTYGLPRS